jgi:NAD(P)-dependent dehydrogenase (short-subunit alcohol dehydrogenase family)
MVEHVALETMPEGKAHPIPREVVLRTLSPRCRPLEGADDRPDIQLIAGGTIWVTAEASPLAEAVCSRLAKRGYHPKLIALDGAEIPAESESLCGLIILAPGSPDEATFIGGAFRVLRSAGPALERAAGRGGAALVTVARLDGAFGVNGLGWDASPVAGGLAGLAKTAAREWPLVHSKAIDLDPAFASAEPAATAIVDELLKSGPTEVGLSRHAKLALELAPFARTDDLDPRPKRLERGDLVVISGGARGITAEVAVALAASFRPRLLILGRSPAPGPEPAWLAGLHNEAEIKRALLARPGGSRAPQAIGEETRRLMVEREIRRNLARMSEAGSPVEYRSIDVRNRATVDAVIAQAQAHHGAIRGLIHGAGVLADRRIIDQTDAQFAAVFDTKVEGLAHLLAAIDPDELACLVVFSSSTARFGRTGQAAYAAANETLNKWAAQQALRLPDCRVISYNWGPWAGGMVNGSLKPLFEKEGLTLIPPAAGARLVVEHLESAGALPVEVVVLAEPTSAETVAAPVRPAAASGIAAGSKLETVFQRAVDLESLPVLASHVIDGHAVLPLALMMEWLAEGAAHRNPGLVVRGLDDVRLFKGVILKDRQRATVEIRAGRAVRDDGVFKVPVELGGTLPSGRDVAHARADVILAERHTTSAARLASQVMPPYPLTRDEVYQSILFHGPALQGIEQIDGCGERALAGWVSAAPAPSEWIDRPLRSRWLTDPLAIDSAFQLLVLWCSEQFRANSLPAAVGRYQQFRPAFPAASVRVVAEIRQASESRAVADVEFLDASGALIARLDAYECVIDRSLNQAFRRNRLVGRVGASS